MSLELWIIYWFRVLKPIFPHTFLKIVFVVHNLTNHFQVTFLTNHFFVSQHCKTFWCVTNTTYHVGGCVIHVSCLAWWWYAKKGLAAGTRERPYWSQIHDNGMPASSSALTAGHPEKSSWTMILKMLFDSVVCSYIDIVYMWVWPRLWVFGLQKNSNLQTWKMVSTRYKSLKWFGGSLKPE